MATMIAHTEHSEAALRRKGARVFDPDRKMAAANPPFPKWLRKVILDLAKVSDSIVVVVVVVVVKEMVVMAAASKVVVVVVEIVTVSK